MDRIRPGFLRMTTHSVRPHSSLGHQILLTRLMSIRASAKKPSEFGKGRGAIVAASSPSVTFRLFFGGSASEAGSHSVEH